MVIYKIGNFNLKFVSSKCQTSKQFRLFFLQSLNVRKSKDLKNKKSIIFFKISKFRTISFFFKSQNLKQFQLFFSSKS